VQSRNGIATTVISSTTPALTQRKSSPGTAHALLTVPV